MRSEIHHTPIKLSFYELRDVKRLCLKILHDCKVAEELSRAAKLKARRNDESTVLESFAERNTTDFSMIRFCDGYHIDQTLPLLGANHFREKWWQEVAALQVSLADDDNAASADSTSDYYSSISESKTSLDKAVSNADLRSTSIANTAIKFVPCGSTRVSNIACSCSNCCCFHSSHDVISEEFSKSTFSMIPLQGCNEEIFERYFLNDDYIDSVAKDDQIGIVFATMKLELPNSTHTNRWDSDERLSVVSKGGDYETTAENKSRCNERLSIHESTDVDLGDSNTTNTITPSTCLCCQCMGKIHRCVSPKPTSTQDQMARLRILIRTEVGLYHVLVPIFINCETKINLKFCNNPILRQDVLTYVSKELSLSDRLVAIRVPPSSFKEIDRHFIKSSIKIGVLYVKEGQNHEDEMFSNQSHSQQFEQFLQVLGDKVILKGFQKYNGGLDTLHGQCGEQSVFTEWRDLQIMFHVSTLLPYDENDPQKVQRKRHLGNDTVCVVFLDGPGAQFAPTSIRSQFLHSFIVVKCRKDRTSDSNNQSSSSDDSPSSCPSSANNSAHQYHYRVGVVSRSAVPAYEPELPADSSFAIDDPLFREWILAKCVNGDRATYAVPKLITVHSRSRTHFHEKLYNSITLSNSSSDKGTPIQSSLSSSCSSSPKFGGVGNFLTKHGGGLMQVLGGGNTCNNKEDVRRTLSNSASNPDTTSSSVSDLSKFSPGSNTPSMGNKFSLSLRSGASKLFRNRSAVAGKFVGQNKKYSSGSSRAATLNLCSDTSHRKISAGSLDITLTKSSEWSTSSPGASESQQINMSMSTGSVCDLNKRSGASPKCASHKPVSFSIEGEPVCGTEQLLRSCPLRMMHELDSAPFAASTNTCITTTSTQLPLTQISSNSTSTNSYSIYHHWTSNSSHASSAEEDTNINVHHSQHVVANPRCFHDTAFPPEVFSRDARIIRGSSFSIPDTLYATQMTSSESPSHQAQPPQSQSNHSHIMLHTAADSFSEESSATT